MSKGSLQERMEEANVRIEKLIWLPGSMVSGSVVEPLKDAIVDDLYNGDNKQVLSKLPKLSSILHSDEEPDDDWIAEALYGLNGFFAQFARPVPSDFMGSKDCFSFSWGHYATKWVYADTMKELVSLAEAFSEEVVSREYAKHVAGGTP